jgi:hypothetical protein
MSLPDGWPPDPGLPHPRGHLHIKLFKDSFVAFAVFVAAPVAELGSQPPELGALLGNPITQAVQEKWKKEAPFFDDLDCSTRHPPVTLGISEACVGEPLCMILPVISQTFVEDVFVPAAAPHAQDTSNKDPQKPGCVGEPHCTNLPVNNRPFVEDFIVSAAAPHALDMANQFP